MSDLTTTLAAIRAQNPCRSGWTKLLKHVGEMPDDAPLPLVTVLDSNGVSDTLWVAYRVIGEPARVALAPFIRECVLRACDYAERVLPVFEAQRPGDDRPRKAIEAARACAAGTIGEREARKAAAAAADAAAYAYAADADAAYAAADAAAREKERAWQAARLREYLTGAAKKEVA